MATRCFPRAALVVEANMTLKKVKEEEKGGFNCQLENLMRGGLLGPSMWGMEGGDWTINFRSQINTSDRQENRLFIFLLILWIRGIW